MSRFRALKFSWSGLRLGKLQWYLLRQFLTTFFICLLTAASLFTVFDLFERIRVFIKEGSSILQATSYFLFKLPLVIQLMTPIAILIAVLLSVGRLSQQSEITAMRACGVSLLWLARPLLIAGLLISLTSFVAGETVVPWSMQKVDEIYHLQIKKKAESGRYSRTHFWYRSKERFYNVGFYDSRLATLEPLSVFEVNDRFQLRKRYDAAQAGWIRPEVGWVMKDVVETVYNRRGGVPPLQQYSALPLVISEKPKDFYNYKADPETLSFRELKKYITKIQNEGVPVTKYQVDLAAKLSFPFVSFIVVLIAFPFALSPARSGTMTTSFVAGVAIGFGYYVVHAIFSSLGSAELIPVTPSAWAANVILGSVGGYFMSGIEAET